MKWNFVGLFFASSFCWSVVWLLECKLYELSTEFQAMIVSMLNLELIWMEHAHMRSQFLLARLDSTDFKIRLTKHLVGFWCCGGWCLVHSTMYHFYKKKGLFFFAISFPFLRLSYSVYFVARHYAFIHFIDSLSLRPFFSLSLSLTPKLFHLCQCVHVGIITV